ncbi:hypothetical protein [Haloferula sp. BvORR071]|uniref:hypothetical protein n=1 Tax=Haloferula sp. BvORR071 TaxID=1396141 RepID=UPI000555E192|nr:hypothetical protein [Haloferula sp. BvORR071]
MKPKWYKDVDLHVVYAGVLVFVLLLGNVSLARRAHWSTLPLWAAVVQELILLPMIFTRFGDMRRRDRERGNRYLFSNLLFVQILALGIAGYCLSRQ